MKHKILLPIFSLIFLAISCHVDETFYDLQSPGFAMVSASDDDFRNSVGKAFSEYTITPGVRPEGLTGFDKLAWQMQHMDFIHSGEHDKSYPRGPLNFYVDGRNSNGFNTWNHPNLTDKFYDKDIDYTASGGAVTGIIATTFGGGSTTSDFSEKYQVRLPVTGPPAYLHLCLNSWDEYIPNVTAGKTWKVQSILDADGKKYGEDDPDWGPYLDNKFRFEKPDRFIIYPGKNYTATEAKYFDNKEAIYGTFIITKLDQVTWLTLILPPTGINGELSMTYLFYIIESGFNKTLGIAGVIEGKFGGVYLIPEN